jgi:magnesium and cobalt exporter, CNNM family
VDDVGWSLLWIFLLCVTALYFSLSNLALRAFSRVKLYEIFRSANKEHIADTLLENTDKYIIACSFFRILANVSIVFLLIRFFDNLLPAILLSILIFEIFSLAVPLAWAQHTGEKILLKTYPILNLFASIASPVLVLFRFHDRLVRRLAGITESTPDQEQEEKQEEIMSVVEQGRMEGIVDEEEAEMIENVLELSDTTAEEIMTPRTDIVAIKVDDDLQAILDTITKAGHSRIPVYEKNIDNIIGLVYAKDLLSHIGKDIKDFKIRDIIRDVYFVPETKPLRILLNEFKKQKLHIAVLLDEYGGTAGIVTIEDILEELVGEIADEYEEIPPETINQIDQNTIELDARAYIDDLNNDFKLDLPEDEDYDTVGGFVFSHLGYIPKINETFVYENVKFTIIDAEARKIKKLRIEKIQIDTGQ